MVSFPEGPSSNAPAPSADGPPALEDVLSDARAEAAVLRSHGHRVQAESIDKVCNAVAEAMREYLAWVNEDQAMLYTGLKVPALRNRFASLADRGLARWDGHRRLYRRVALEHRGNAEAERERGRRAAERVAGGAPAV